MSIKKTICSSRKLWLERLDQLGQDQFLKLARSALSSTPFLSELALRRGRGRNDYPISLLWKCAEEMVAGKLPSFSLLGPSFEGPSRFSFSRFLSSLADKSDWIDRWLFEMAEPGQIAAIGSTVLHKQRYTFLWDAASGIPFAWEVGGPLSAALARLLSRIPQGRIRFLIGGSEYDFFSRQIWEKWRIRPIIPLANESGERKKYQAAVYDEKGTVYCLGATMLFGGFEEARESLKFLCPARHYGYKCNDLGRCPLEKNIRIPLEEDPRIFVPLPRFSYRWQSLWVLYDKTKAVEAILLSRTSRSGKNGVFLRIASLLFAAAYRTKKFSKRALI